MANAATWKRRVAEWRASVVTAPQFAAGRGFAPTTLMWWSWRLRQDEGGRAAPGQVLAGAGSGCSGLPLARVIRVSGQSEAPVVIEHGSLRILLRGGFERATLMSVLDALDTRAGRQP